MGVLLFPERDCSKCTPQHQKSYGCNAQLKTIKGVEVWVDKSTLPLRIDGEEVWQCPRRFVYENPLLFSEIWRAYRHYMSGFLPDPGSANEQPYKLMRFIEIVRDTVDEVKADKADRTGTRPKGPPKGATKPKAR